MLMFDTKRTRDRINILQLLNNVLLSESDLLETLLNGAPASFPGGCLQGATAAVRLRIQVSAAALCHALERNGRLLGRSHFIDALTTIDPL